MLWDTTSSKLVILSQVLYEYVCYKFLFELCDTVNCVPTEHSWPFGEDGGMPLPLVCVYLFGLCNILTTGITDSFWHSGNIIAVGSDDSLHSCCF